MLKRPKVPLLCGWLCHFSKTSLENRSNSLSLKKIEGLRIVVAWKSTKRRIDESSNRKTVILVCSGLVPLTMKNCWDVFEALSFGGL